MFDALGDFFQDHRLFGEKKKQSRVQQRVKKTLAEITSADLRKYERHKDQPKSIFNPRNTHRIVHYKAERFYLLDRDMRMCVYCGCGSTEQPLQPDHIIPYTKVPVTHMDNLGMSCADCNSGKSDGILTRSTLVDVLQLVSERNDRHFPNRTYKQYRRDYCKLLT